MFPIIASAVGLVAVTIIIHAHGLVIILRNIPESMPKRWWSMVWMLIRMANWLTVIACIEIAVWGLFYLKMGLMGNAEAAFYFSGVTYTSIGYGDLVLPEAWRMLAPIQGLIGILMSGISASVFFAVIFRLHELKYKAITSHRSPNNEPP